MHWNKIQQKAIIIGWSKYLKTLPFGVLNDLSVLIRSDFSLGFAVDGQKIALCLVGAQSKSL